MKTSDFHNLEFVMNLLGKRIVPCYFFQKNPRMVTRWQFNACRQTAVVCAQVANMLLVKWGYNKTDDEGEYDPDVNQYNVQVWDGNFADPTQGEYNHAWVYLEHNLDPDKNILIDTARVTRNIGVVFSDNEPSKHLTCSLTGKQSREIDRKPMPLGGLTGIGEYYTKQTSDQIFEDILEILGVYFKEFKPDRMYA